MLFASTELAARIERADCDLVAACAAALEARRPAVRPLVRPIAGGMAVCGPPGSPMNKVAGLGFGGTLEEAELAEVERAFAEREVPTQVELASLADPSIAPLLTARGYALVGFENVLGCPLLADSRSPRDDRIDVRRSGDEDFALWLDLVVTGFETPDTQGVPSHEAFARETLEPVIQDMASAPGFVRHVAYRGDEPAGGASMRLHDGVAQLCGAATLPAHRRRGVQTALLRERLDLAAREGCDVAVVVTQPGSKSMENVLRQGFELLYVRAILVRESP